MIKRIIANIVTLALILASLYYYMLSNAKGDPEIIYITSGKVDSLSSINDSLVNELSDIERKYNAVLIERSRLYMKIDSMSMVIKDFDRKIDSIYNTAYFYANLRYDVFNVNATVYGRHKPDSIRINISQWNPIVVTTNILRKSDEKYIVKFKTNSSIIKIDSAEIFIKRNVSSRKRIWVQGGIGGGIFFAGGYGNWGIGYYRDILFGKGNEAYLIMYRKEW